MALSKIVENSLADEAVSSAKLKDFSAAVDLNGVELVLDADADTSITADTDDRIDFKIAGVEHFSFSNSSGDTIIKPMVDAKDIKFQQYDGRTLLDINDGGFIGIANGATGAGAIRIFEDTDNGSNYVGLTAGSISSSFTLTLPTADGSSGQFLKTDGSGALSFDTVSSAADDLTTGDAAVTIATSSGNITIDAQAGDADIIFKGTDGSSDITPMTLDMSDAGALFLTGGKIDLKNSGTRSKILFYCESSNAHAQTLQAAPHSESASNTLTLPSTGGNVDLVSTASTATLTNKTLTTPIIAEIDSGSSITLDATTDIILDADGADIIFKDGGTSILTITNNSTDVDFIVATQDKDINFKGDDGGSGITALSLDMSDAGTAIFNHDIKIADDGQIGSASAADAMIISSGGIVTFKDDILIKDGGTIGSASDADAIAIASDGDVTFSQKVGVISDHDLGTGLHIKTADSGAGVATDSDELVIEGSGASGLSILSGNTSNGKIAFNDDGGNSRGAVIYEHDGDNLRFQTAAADALKIDSAGHVTKPKQPAFSAQSNSTLSNVPTNNAVQTIPFGTEIFDLNADYNNSNYTFTAPVTGKYLLTFCAVLANVDKDANYIICAIRTSNRNYGDGNMFGLQQNPGDEPRVEISQTILADMDANDTATVGVQQYEGAAQMDITDDTAFFMGHLVA